jgi:hypothetical protein
LDASLAEAISASTRSGVKGRTAWVVPRASAIALATAAVDPMVPPSPMPLVPSSWTVDGVTRCLISTAGASPEVGRR